MSIINKLSSSLNRRDELPNIKLAKEIADRNDKNAVKELIETLQNKSLQNDCIKVIYEIGERKPALIAGYAKEMIALLEHKNNRLQWGAMTALHTITLENQKVIYAGLGKIIAAADRGSVITRDNAVNILIQLCSIRKYADTAFSLLSEQLLSCPPNQLAMYAEKSLPVITDNNKIQFLKAVTSRLADIEKETIRKRVEKVIRKLS